MSSEEDEEEEDDKEEEEDGEKEEKRRGRRSLYHLRVQKRKEKKTAKINVSAKMTQRTKVRKCRSLGAWSADASGFQNTS